MEAVVVEEMVSIVSEEFLKLTDNYELTTDTWDASNKAKKDKIFQSKVNGDNVLMIDSYYDRYLRIWFETDYRDFSLTFSDDSGLSDFRHFEKYISHKPVKYNVVQFLSETDTKFKITFMEVRKTVSNFFDAIREKRPDVY